MRENKKAVQILSIIILVSLILYFLCFYIKCLSKWEHLEFTKNILVGVCCSSIVSVIICLINYFVIKRRNIQEFIRIENKILSDIQIDTLKTPFNQELYLKLLYELSNKYCDKIQYDKAIKKFGKSKEIKEGFDLNKHVAKDKIIEFTANELDFPFKDKIEKNIMNNVNDNKKEVETIIQQYKHINEIDVIELQNIENEFCCFLNKSIKKSMCEIIESNIKLKNDIATILFGIEKDSTIYFKIISVIKMQDIFFEIERKIKDKTIIITFNRKFKNNIIDLSNQIILEYNEKATPLPKFSPKSLYRITIH